MQIIFFTTDTNNYDEFKKRHNVAKIKHCYDITALQDMIQNIEEYILIVDYDSVANELNKLITSDTLPKNVVVVERTPAIATGKMLIAHTVKAYANTKMLTIHYNQIIKTVALGKIWTYPELTTALIIDAKTPAISSDAIELIDKRLSIKEKEVVYLVLDGLTNVAISSKLDITIRTVKAHISSIFSKLHISDRISLILLLR